MPEGFGGGRHQLPRPQLGPLSALRDLGGPDHVVEDEDDDVLASMPLSPIRTQGSGRGMPGGGAGGTRALQAKSSKLGPKNSKFFDQPKNDGIYVVESPTRGFPLNQAS